MSKIKSKIHLQMNILERIKGFTNHPMPISGKKSKPSLHILDDG